MDSSEIYYVGKGEAWGMFGIGFVVGVASAIVYFNYWVLPYLKF